MADFETIAIYDRQVDTYAKIIKEQGIDPMLMKFISVVESGGHVLDLGCGPATSAAIMRDQGLSVDPIDASQEMVQLANKTYDIGARQALFCDINEVDTYHGIWANFSLLHATEADFPIILKRLHRALKTGGCFYIGMKIGAGAKRDKLGRFYAYYSEQALNDYLVNAGFIVDVVKTGEQIGMAGDVEPWISILAYKH